MYQVICCKIISDRSSHYLQNYLYIILNILSIGGSKATRPIKIQRKFYKYWILCFYFDINKEQSLVTKYGTIPDWGSC